MQREEIQPEKAVSEQAQLLFATKHFVIDVLSYNI